MASKISAPSLMIEGGIAGTKWANLDLVDSKIQPYQSKASNKKKSL